MFANGVPSKSFTFYPMTQFAFPSGWQLTNVYDALYRRSEVENTGGSSMAAWQFFGLGAATLGRVFA